MLDGYSYWEVEGLHISESGDISYVGPLESQNRKARALFDEPFPLVVYNADHRVIAAECKLVCLRAAFVSSITCWSWRVSFA